MEQEFELVGEMGLLIGREVAAGFSNRAEIVELAVEMHEDDAEENELRALAEELTGSALYQHLKDQRGWPLVTDCDRLDIAFAQLEEKGIVARQNFSCCGTCGAGEILDEMEQATAAGNPSRGYAFYHQQDTESAVEGHGLCLNYGTDSSNESEEAALRIGHEIVDALRKQGLEVDWNGAWSKRISVRLDWKRRRNWSGED